MKLFSSRVTYKPPKSLLSPHYFPIFISHHTANSLTHSLTYNPPYQNTITRFQVAPRNNIHHGSRRILRKSCRASLDCNICRSETNNLQIKSLFQTIGACLMAIVNGIAGVLTAIVGAIASFFNIIISCLTCGKAGRRRGGGHSTRTSHV